MKLAIALCVIVCALLPVCGSAQTLQNPHFVMPYTYIDSNTSVANSWTHYRLSGSTSCQIMQSLNEQMPGGPGGQVSCQQIWSDGNSFEAGFYQRVLGAVVGRTYRVSGWLMSIYDFGVDHTPIYQDGSIYQKIGIDPYGGTDPNSANVIWSWDDPLDKSWREVMVDAAAKATAITVFARTRNTASAPNCMSFHDAFTLAQSNPIKFVHDSLGNDALVRPGATKATVSWTTDVLSDSKVEYAVYRGNTKSVTTKSSAMLTTKHSITITNLLPSTKYYYRIISTASGKDFAKTFNTFTTTSGSEFSSLNSAKNNPDTTRVYVRNLYCTAGTDQLNNTFYLQELDRSGGIRVDRPGISNISTGSFVDICGNLSSVSGERKLTSASITFVPKEYADMPVTTPVPFAMRTTSIGGSYLDAYDQGVLGGTGPNNTGLLVRVWGRIASVDTSNKFFYIDDGSHFWDGAVNGRYGLKVSWSLSKTAITPVVGKYAFVTGLSACFLANSNTLPQVYLRSSTDFAQL